ncbi:hypothetical protein TrLO_g13444 [Triparma laevis f. longispina]|uniref:Uncharacterized protein n=1 Tax=Triparma laevis f. longispina TaxID=1714387 RepID=A0A9W7FV55_9STRA|nr:hypothetical protein TrLO_g13444 [Triparma laevis f. longispina]
MPVEIRDKLLLETDNITSEETIKDIEMQGPYFAAFCLQYTPQMYNHEETQVLKKIIWVFATKAVQFAAVLLANNKYLVNLACVRTAASSTFLVATNLWHMRFLLQRPYASHGPSSKFGDPMNEAELLTTRTISLAAALLSLRDTLATSTVTGEAFAHGFTTNNWMMDVFCALVLFFVVRANIRLFAGLDVDLRISASTILSSVRSSSTRDSAPSMIRPSEEETRSRGHTGASEIVFFQIDQMLCEESYRRIIMLQKELRIDEMHEAERNRWTEIEQQPHTKCRRLCDGLIFLLKMTVIGTVLYCGMHFVSGTHFPEDVSKPSAWFMPLLPLVLYAIMEILIWRTKRSKSTNDGEVEVEVEIESDHNDNGDEENQAGGKVSSPLQDLEMSEIKKES